MYGMWDNMRCKISNQINGSQVTLYHDHVALQTSTGLPNVPSQLMKNGCLVSQFMDHDTYYSDRRVIAMVMSLLVQGTVT
jgi:hypothetical protein